MEDEKKKKRNKKKKNKQTKLVENAVARGEAASVDPIHVEDDRVAQNGNGQDADASLLHHHSNAVGAAAVAEVEKDKPLVSTDSMEEKIKQLEEITASHVQKEAALEEKVKQLQDENGLHLQKEAFIEETTTRLKNDNHAHIQKVAKLEETIMHLRKENDTLTREKSNMENKVRQLLDERSTFSLKEASLEEKLRQLEQDIESWLAKEKLSKETISCLDNETTRLRSHVLELEESKSYLLQQNESLMENVSKLEFRLTNLEGNTPSANTHNELKKGGSEDELNAQIKAACALVEKLITENTELVEKVNELCIKLNHQSLSLSHSSAGNDSLQVAAETMNVADVVSLSTEIIPGVVHKSKSLDDVPIDDEVCHSHSDSSRDRVPASVNTNSWGAESGEIVPVSLGANGNIDMESDVVEGGVPLTDAPLIGAPFRLVSFIARYVSGADLVEKNPLISRY